MSDLGADRLIVIGGQRCGSTSLHKLLASHPQISMIQPARPEPKLFFGRNYSARLDAHEREHPVAAGRLSGEKSAGYLESPLAASRIADRYPEARIIAILRDPIARAVSNYWYTRSNGLEPLSLTDALTTEAEHRSYDAAAISASPYHYLRRGRYRDHLDRYVERFPRRSVHVVILEDLTTRPGAAAELFDFLDRDRDEAARFDREGASVADEREQIPPEHRRRLRDHFAGPNERLSVLLDRDVTEWWGRSD